MNIINNTVQNNIIKKYFKEAYDLRGYVLLFV